jgi:putative tricarboxylic transport membrane protein
MKIREIITGICTILIAGYLWVLSRNIPLQDLKAGLGPAFFPFLSLIILGILGIVYLIFNLLVKEVQEEKKPSSNRFPWSTIIISVFLIIYAASFKSAGFIISTFLFLIFSMIILKVKWVSAIFISLLATSGLYLIFITFFKVPLP